MPTVDPDSRPDSRPDPDALLRRVQDEEAKERRGKLKIFFGFAPGVGKTYRMLQVARDLVYDQRLDVVVGLVETHRRMETAAMMLGLELMPRRKVDYRGTKLEELDLDAVLARHPRLVLVDELAHTNAPGSRHPKRWQDVLELLDAGIDVFTTVNVQHVESLNDVVAQITHVQVRETVPDSILDRADEIELVDIAPEELLTRLREGKVYLTDQARRAADHFFKRGNLLALRELALRRTAQRVDDDVREYREQHGVSATWPAGERVLVCVGPAPSSSRLIRAAARIAAGVRAPWIAAYVGGATGGIGDADRDRLDAHLRLVETLGGTVTRLTGSDVGEALLGYARKHNITRIVLGKPTHSRLRDRVRGSLLDQIVRGSDGIDVHVIGGGVADDAEPERGPHAASAAPLLPTYGGALALVAITTVIAVAVNAWTQVPDLAVLYLLAVMIAATRWGRGPSLVAAAAGVAVYDFLFVPPYYTFAVADARYVLTFAMMFGVGFVVSELTTRIRRQEQEAIGREERTAALYALSRDLGSADDLADVAATAARHAAMVFDAAAFVLRPDPVEPTELQTLGVAPASASLDPKDLGVVRWSYERGTLAGLGTDTLPGSAVISAPLRIGPSTHGVLALAPRSRAPLRLEQQEFLEAFTRQVAFALERAHLADAARAAALRAETEEMRSTLLSAVSHDLRTPLAAITGAASTLRDGDGLTPATRVELLDSIGEEAERMERLVGNLLDMTRLESGAVVLRRDWLPLEELVGSALTRLGHRLGGRPIKTDLAPDLPLISVDPVLLEQVFVNLLENAAKYTPADSPIEITARRNDGKLEVDVMDRGPGIPPGVEDRLFEKFYRGTHVGVAGVGLGLPICRGIMTAHGGTITARARPGGGAVFHLELPLLDGAPSTEEPR